MKFLSLIIGTSFLVGALALSHSGDTLGIQNSDSPQRGVIDGISQAIRTRKPNGSRPKNRIDVFTKPRSCSNQGWYCEDNDRCRYCNGVCKIKEGKDYGKCVDVHRPPSCAKEARDCESSAQCASCDGICKIEEGENTGICVDKPQKCTDLYTDCKTSADCGYCGGTCDILEGEKFGLCIDKEENLENAAQSRANKIIIVITE
ncbi:hypothetical protein TWF106_009959 [Orbilia oligospora]|uniref:Uncharacterized protein n=1 Tax=Orbilia oligospora TaxID=2813651 RepID=A0A7C8V2A8_ORBOL|nr:hypothetical protein TWF788_004435 [Orbilia oligospora]KAF3227448.1 hypothetical protein TWF106_009959 [Orbilia oligospora]